jgi:hypothetical protein
LTKNISTVSLQIVLSCRYKPKQIIPIQFKAVITIRNNSYKVRELSCHQNFLGTPQP